MKSRIKDLLPDLALPPGVQTFYFSLDLSPFPWSPSGAEALHTLLIPFNLTVEKPQIDHKAFNAQ